MLLAVVAGTARESVAVTLSRLVGTSHTPRVRSFCRGRHSHPSLRHNAKTTTTGTTGTTPVRGEIKPIVSTIQLEYSIEQ